MRAHASSVAHQRGLSIVELLVGIAVGLFVVAATAMLAGTQLGENRRMLLEAQIQQDLRASLDIITRELRRSGSWTFAQQGIWISSKDPAVANPIPAVTPAAPPATQEVAYAYQRPGTGGTNPSGFRLQGGVIQSRFAYTGAWQDLTDTNTLVVTAFSVTPRHVEAPSAAVDKLPCPKLCPGGGMDCWPSLVVREFQINVTGRSPDGTVQRTVESIVRLRNDELRLGVASICPA